MHLSLPTCHGEWHAMLSRTFTCRHAHVCINNSHVQNHALCFHHMQFAMQNTNVSKGQLQISVTIQSMRIDSDSITTLPGRFNRYCRPASTTQSSILDAHHRTIEMEEKEACMRKVARWTEVRYSTVACRVKLGTNSCNQMQEMSKRKEIMTRKWSWKRQRERRKASEVELDERKLRTPVNTCNLSSFGKKRKKQLIKICRKVISPPFQSSLIHVYKSALPALQTNPNSILYLLLVDMSKILNWKLSKRFSNELTPVELIQNRCIGVLLWMTFCLRSCMQLAL